MPERTEYQGPASRGGDEPIAHVGEDMGEAADVAVWALCPRVVEQIRRTITLDIGKDGSQAVADGDGDRFGGLGLVERENGTYIRA